MTTPRRLVVMRHAKAEGYAATDHDRRLTERGHRDAADAGRFLADLGVVPDHVLVSSATRTQETWAEVHAECGGEPSVDVTRALYGAGPEDVLEAVRSVPHEAGTVMFVGHNPTAATVAYLLDDGKGDAGATEVLLEGFPTSALAVFEVEDPWTGVGGGVGRLTHAHVGRG